MNPANFLLKSLSQLSNSIPYNRKRTHFYISLSKILIGLGAKSVVSADMNDGTKMIVDLSSKTERAVYFDGKYDDDLLEVIHTLINKDSVFLDIGANIGFYSASIGNFYRMKKSKGKIISFEPFKGNFNRLIENISTNHLNSYCIANNFRLSDVRQHFV